MTFREDVPALGAVQDPAIATRAAVSAAFRTDGWVGIVWRSDRYVDVEREFGRLLEGLVAARRAPTE